MNEKYNSLAKNDSNRKVALLSILIQLDSLVTKKVFWPQPKNVGYDSVKDFKIVFIDLISIKLKSKYYLHNNKEILNFMSCYATTRPIS